MYVPNPSLLKEKLEVWGSLPNIRCCVKGLFTVKVCLNFCYPFDVGIFSFIQYAQYVGVTQLRSGFSQRELLYLSLYSRCICGKRKIQELPMSPSWFGVIKILINIFVTIYEFSMLRDITSILQMIIMSQRGLRNSLNIMQLECIRSKI